MPPEARHARQAALLVQLGLPAGGWREVEQVHGPTTCELGAGPAPQPPPRADGLISRRPGLGLSIRTADCVPLLAASRGDGPVGALHAGWRGTVAGAVAQWLAALAAAGAAPAQLVIGLGPAIGPCCFAVGPAVAEQLWRVDPGRGRTPAACSWPGRVDLPGLVRRQLVAGGVPAAQIGVSPTCTACTPSWASYRRDGARAGRQVALVGRRPAP